MIDYDSVEVRNCQESTRSINVIQGSNFEADEKVHAICLRMIRCVALQFRAVNIWHSGSVVVGCLDAETV